MLDRDQVSKIVNTAYEGVEKSVIGSIIIHPDKNDLSSQQVSQIAFGVFTIVLTAMMRDSGKE